MIRQYKNQSPPIDDKNKNTGGLTKEIATRENSVDFMSSMIMGLPNPDPVLKKLNRDIEIYNDILYDSRVTAIVASRKAAVKSMEWEVVGEDTPEDQIDFYTDLFNSYKMEDIIGEILDAPLFGYKPMEIVWDVASSQFIPRLVGKPPDWFTYDIDNNLRFLSKNNQFFGDLVPPNRFIVARNEATYDNPFGKPVLSSCYWPVIFRHNGLKFWTIFVEKYGMPFLLAKAPQGARTEQIEEVADLLENMVQDAIAVVPKDYEIELAEAAEGKGKADSLHKVYIDVMNLEIAMSIIGTNLTTEVQGGSQAAAKSHMEVRADIIEGDQKIVQGTFNELIQITHAFNFGTTKPPKLRLFAEEKVDKTRSERDKNLTDQGVRFTKEYYKSKYNLNDDDFDLKEESSEPSQNGGNE